MRKSKRKHLKRFIKEINQFNKGKTPKNLKVYEYNFKTKKRRRIINKITPI